MIELLTFILVFVLVSGFLAMIDAAILSVSPAEVEVMIAKKRRGAVQLKQLLKHTTRAIIVIVILTNVTNILGPILAGRKAEALYGSESIGVITAILTFTTIIFSEIIPKSIGALHAPRISRLIAPLLRALVFLLFPIVIAIEKLVRIFKSGKRNVGTEEQIRALANLGGGAGHIDADERDLIHRAFVLNDRTTRDVMTPAEKIVFCHKGTTVRQAAELVFRYNFSRYPVVGNSLDEVAGYILSREVLVALADGKDGMQAISLVRSMSKVSADTRCDDLLHVLRKNESQLAIVTDNGKTVGIVALEDVLEELVGEIRDESGRVTHQGSGGRGWI